MAVKGFNLKRYKKKKILINYLCDAHCLRVLKNTLGKSSAR